MLFKSLKKVLIFSLILMLFASIALAKQPAKYQPTIDKQFQNVDFKTINKDNWWVDFLYFSNFFWSYLNIGCWPGTYYFGYWIQQYPAEWDCFVDWWYGGSNCLDHEMLFWGETIYGNRDVMNGSIWQFTYDTGGYIDGYDIEYLGALDSISQQDILTGFHDEAATSKHKLYVSATWRILQWNYPNVDDFSANIYTLVNYGTKTTEPFWFYFMMDWDIPYTDYENDCVIYHEDTWASQHYNRSTELSGGFRFLNTVPYSMNTTDWDDPYWEEMDVNKAEDEFDYLWLPQIFNSRPDPDDYRTHHLMGPITLAPGETYDIIFAFVFGTSLGMWDANNAALTETYEAGWKPPNPPPDAPYIVLSPGDRSVTIRWTRNRSVNPKTDQNGNKDYTEYPDSTYMRSAESSVDPNTYIRDWDGYLIYRNMTGSGEIEAGAWHLIAEMNSTYVYNTWGTIPNSDLDARYWTTTYWAEYTDVDPGLYNGYRYYYSIVAYDAAKSITNPGANVQNIVLNWRAESTADNVKVVPNPYVVSNPPGFVDGVQFIHLPATCNIKIYSFGGDYITTLYHANNTGNETWNLRNENDQLVAPGVYFYVVDSDQGTAKGKFVIIH